MTDRDERIRTICSALNNDRRPGARKWTPVRVLRRFSSDARLKEAEEMLQPLLAERAREKATKEQLAAL